MPIESSMSLPTRDIRTNHTLLRDLVCAQELFVNGFKLITANSTAATPASSKSLKWAIRTLENSGITAVYWGVGAVPSAGGFHGVLRACTAADDGTGGFVDISRFNGDIFLVAVTGAPRVAIFEATAPEGL